VRDGDVPRWIRQVPSERAPERGICDLHRPEGGRHDADDLVRFPADVDRPADDAGIAAETIPPDPMAEDDDPRRIRHVVGLDEQAPQFRLHAEGVEVRICGLFAGKRFRQIAARQRRVPAPNRRDALEHARAGRPVRLVCGTRPFGGGPAACGQVDPDHHQP
jgi:hypothetical protein